MAVVGDLLLLLLLFFWLLAVSLLLLLVQLLLLLPVVVLLLLLLFQPEEVVLLAQAQVWLFVPARFLQPHRFRLRQQLFHFRWTQKETQRRSRLPFRCSVQRRRPPPSSLPRCLRLRSRRV